VDIIFVNFNSLVQIDFPENLYNLQVSKAATGLKGTLGKTNMQHCKVYHFELDNACGSAKSTFEFTLTLD
jgi:hypothetical protein